MTLAELEKIIDMKFPKKFHEIYETGAMEWIEAGCEKFNENRERYLNDPKAFLMLCCDCEPIFFEDIPDAIEELNEDLKYRKEDTGEELDGKYRLIPFGMNGAGDKYCFLCEESADEPKIIMYAHDTFDNPEIIGNDFDEFLYMMMLSAAAYAVDDDDFTELESGQWENNLGYLNDGYRKIITESTPEKLAGFYWAIDFEEAEIFS